eukprot:PLAT15500.2.p1 GENE.PLAT15500.2~~PLAT15500.2.p1  ORF type:complete len:1411 (+),score=685.88 PLAT15500.2:39-4235(+)
MSSLLSLVPWQCDDAEVSVTLKRLWKKDAVTRLKGMTELQELLRSRSVEEMKAILPAWARAYTRLPLDNSRRVRQAGQEVHAVIVEAVGADLVSVLPDIILPWLLLQHDPTRDVSRRAEAAYHAAFVRSKRARAYYTFRDALEAGLPRTLEETSHSVKRRSGVMCTSGEDSQDCVLRLHCSAGRSIASLLRMLPQKKAASMASALLCPAAWQLLSSEAPLARAAGYALLEAAVECVPEVVAERLADVGPVALAALGESSRENHSAMLSSILQLCHALPAVWSSVERPERHIFPKLFALLREGFRGSGESSYPAVAPLFSVIPAAVRAAWPKGGEPGFLTALLSALWKGHAAASAVEEAMLTAYTEVAMLGVTVKSDEEKKADDGYDGSGGVEEASSVAVMRLVSHHLTASSPLPDKLTDLLTAYINKRVAVIPALSAQFYPALTSAFRTPLQDGTAVDGSQPQWCERVASLLPTLPVTPSLLATVFDDAMAAVEAAGLSTESLPGLHLAAALQQYATHPLAPERLQALLSAATPSLLPAVAALLPGATADAATFHSFLTPMLEETPPLPSTLTSLAVVLEAFAGKPAWPLPALSTLLTSLLDQRMRGSIRLRLLSAATAVPNLLQADTVTALFSAAEDVCAELLETRGAGNGESAVRHLDFLTACLPHAEPPSPPTLAHHVFLLAHARHTVPSELPAGVNLRWLPDVSKAAHGAWKAGLAAVAAEGGADWAASVASWLAQQMAAPPSDASVWIAPVIAATFADLVEVDSADVLTAPLALDNEAEWAERPLDVRAQTALLLLPSLPSKPDWLLWELAAAGGGATVLSAASQPLQLAVARASRSLTPLRAVLSDAAAAAALADAQLSDALTAAFDLQQLDALELLLPVAAARDSLSPLIAERRDAATAAFSAGDGDKLREAALLWAACPAVDTPPFRAFLERVPSALGDSTSRPLLRALLAAVPVASSPELAQQLLLPALNDAALADAALCAAVARSLRELPAMTLPPWIAAAGLLAARSPTLSVDAAAQLLSAAESVADEALDFLQPSQLYHWLLCEDEAAQAAAYRLLQRAVAVYEAEEVEEVKAEDGGEESDDDELLADAVPVESLLPAQLADVLQHAGFAVESPSEQVQLGYLRAWSLMLDVMQRLSRPSQGALRAWLAACPQLIGQTMAFSPCLLPVTSKRAAERARQREAAGWPLMSLSRHVVLHSMRQLPDIVRQWYLNDCERALSSSVVDYTRKHVTPALFDLEVAHIVKADLGAAVSVRATGAARQLQASYATDDESIDLLITLRETYPLKLVDVEVSCDVGLRAERCKGWILGNKDKSLLDVIVMWKENLDKELDGLDPCMICLCIIHGSNHKLPGMKCRTCSNSFHAPCLLKWFRSSHKSNCPLCQQPW